MSSSPLAAIGRYYAGRLAEHGASARGVDWNGPESQRLRFAQLLRVCEGAEDLVLNDIGCGYGALYDYLAERGGKTDYLGVDISAEMVAKAIELHGGRPDCRFLVGERPDRVADYSVASGIFNVKLDTPPPQWRAIVLRTLEAVDAASRRGFAFNCLTKYSDPERMKDYLYYADPCELFDHCKTRFSREVALLHDYGLYEFTIVVRKSP